MRKLLLLGLLLVVGVSVVSWQMLSATGKAQEERPGRLDESRSILDLQGIGYVEPVSEVRRLTFRTGGVIRQCLVNVGDTVRQGALLLVLDDTVQKAEVEVAKKQLELSRAEATHINSGVNPYRIRALEQVVERLREQQRHHTAEARRLEKLLGSRAASQQESDAMETQRRQSELALREQEAELLHLRNHVTPEHKALLEAKVRQAQAGVELAEQHLRETRLLAPFDGTVLKILKREGEGVRLFEPEPVVLFGDLSRLRVRAEMDERLVQHLAVGQEAVVYGRNLGDKAYPGRVVLLEKLMGDKTVFTRASSERKDLDVLQLLVELGPDFQAPAGLQVDVRIKVRVDHGEVAQRR